MPSPAKSIHLVTGHRTKDEIEQRAQAEAAMLTNTEMSEWPEVKSSPIAHKRFTLIKALLKTVEKDDAIYEPVINRYCLIQAETYQLDQLRHRIAGQIRELVKRKAEMDFLEFMTLSGKLNDQLFSCDRATTTKRKMLLDIEKENIMTIASQMRAVPKKVEKKEKTSGVSAFMNKRNGGGG